jgi:hypothetical protein
MLILQKQTDKLGDIMETIMIVLGSILSAGVLLGLGGYVGYYVGVRKGYALGVNDAMFAVEAMQSMGVKEPGKVMIMSGSGGNKPEGNC